MRDNECFLKRLQNRKSTYNVFEWEHDRRNQIRDIKRICKYPLSISTKRVRRKGKNFSQQFPLILDDFTSRNVSPRKQRKMQASLMSYNEPNKTLYDKMMSEKIGAVSPNIDSMIPSPDHEEMLKENQA